MTAEQGAASVFESGRFGRMALIRLRPNLDLVEGVEQACIEHGISNAVVRGAVGSLVDAALGFGHGADAGLVSVQGPGIEILTLIGEIRPGHEGRPHALLSGTISDSDAEVYGGVFVRGGNPICITLELVLQEWIPDETA